MHSDGRKSLLVKFLKHEYVDDLRKGKLYCNPISFFREAVQENPKMGDSQEGMCLFSYKDKIVHIKLCGSNNFIFCMYNLQPRKRKKGYDNFRMSMEDVTHFKKFFYDTKDIDSVVIINPDEFIRRLIKGVSDQNKYGYSIKCLHSMVEYVDKRNNNIYPAAKEVLYKEREKIIFFKDIVYKEQNEYRFMFYNVPECLLNSRGALVLNIGDLDDIIMITRNVFKT